MRLSQFDHMKGDGFPGKVLVSENGTTWREFPIPGPAASQTHVKVNGPARYVTDSRRRRDAARASS